MHGGAFKLQLMSAIQEVLIVSVAVGRLRGTAVLIFLTMCVWPSAKLRDEFTIFLQGAFSLLPFEFPGSSFKRAKEAQKYINDVVSGKCSSQSEDWAYTSLLF